MYTSYLRGGGTKASSRCTQSLKCITKRQRLHPSTCCSSLANLTSAGELPKSSFQTFERKYKVSLQEVINSQQLDVVMMMMMMMMMNFESVHVPPTGHRTTIVTALWRSNHAVKRLQPMGRASYPNHRAGSNT